MQAKQLEEQFEDLERRPSGDGAGTLELRIPSSSEFHLHIGVRKPGGTRTFRLRVSDGALAGCDLPRLAGLQIESQRTVDGHNVFNDLCLGTSSSSYNGVFATLVHDLLTSVSSISNSHDAVMTVLDRLLQWQRFLQRLRDDGLTREEQRGLFGELDFLRSLILTAVSPIVAVESWRGPDGAPHDFEFAEVAIEIKTIFGDQSNHVRISNEYQLQEEGNPLYLHCIMGGVSTQGASLNDSVEWIRVALTAEAEALLIFEDKLKAAGYFDLHRDHYADLTYRIKSKSTYHVQADFPRIIASLLPTGLSSVAYSVDLRECDRFLRSDFNINDFLSMR